MINWLNKQRIISMKIAKSEKGYVTAKALIYDFKFATFNS